MARDPELEVHRQWIAYIQPVGLVVSPVALAGAQAYVDRNIVHEHVRFREFLESQGGADGGTVRVRDLTRFFTEILGWEPADLAGAEGGPALPAELAVPLPEYEERLSPTYAVPSAGGGSGWLMLIRVEAPDVDLDRDIESHERAWKASPQVRFERLLRADSVPVGLLANGECLRLVYAPSGESSGHVTFRWKDLAETAGRPMFGALRMLLSAERLWTLPTPQRLPAILEASRKSQNLVSTKLAEQVLDALHELTRGFQSANAASRSALLGDLVETDPDQVYGGLLTALLRLVFLLYAEDRGLMPKSELYTRFYSVNGLYERLRDDAARYPGMLDERYGGWSQLLTLFRLVHEGAAHPALRMPRRHGRLFDPDAYPFLEGRQPGSSPERGQPLTPPRVSDGVVFEILSKLMVLDGERLSYRTLDVEQIGSVYESMMGFRLERARGVSLGLAPDHVVVDLDAVLALEPAARVKRLKDEASCDITGAALEVLKSATTVEELAAALSRRQSRRTPRLLAPGSLYLQPTEERRRSGSHYTPRSLTEPIVRTTLDPLIEALGPRPTAERLLDMKVCDPAMGSGAFLVAACRYLGEKVVSAWQQHGTTPEIPPDEDPLLHAQRLVSQKCLYGVDKNPFAVDLAKLSLWLTTLAREHPFTFLDHALKCGDSLVGLSREALCRMHWDEQAQISVTAALVMGASAESGGHRAFLMRFGDAADDDGRLKLLADAEKAVDRVRLVGDAVIAAFFSETMPKARVQRLAEFQPLIAKALAEREVPKAIADAVRALRSGGHPVRPFHWEIEFPEVFDEGQEGFDAVVGNPPFAGKNTVIGGNRKHYLPWLQQLHEGSHGNADLVAHFFRRAFGLLRKGGTLGLIATNTIAQGDTRGSGLRWIGTHGGTIFAARRRVKWPGQAAVVVSVVHVAKDREIRPAFLDGRPVDRITAFLFHDGGHEDPKPLAENEEKSFQGPIVLGMGFTFDDDNPDATPIAEMERLIAKDPKNRERIFPYIGGEEVNDSPTHAHRRYVINFGEMTEEEARRWPDLMRVVEAKVRPERMKLGDNADAKRRRENWWLWGRYTPALFAALEGRKRVLVCCRHQQYWMLAIVNANSVMAESLVVFPLEAQAGLAVLQSRVHEAWARFFASSLEDRLRYTPDDCFVTFPFPSDWSTNRALDLVGRDYHDHRAALMIGNDEGLTTTYNRFHDPDERDPRIVKLHELHDAMDRAVLDAYGWTDIRPNCEFLLDYEDEDDDEDSGRTRRKKKPWRYRWPDDIRDELLARLIALNQARARDERLSGAAAERAGQKRKGALTARKATTPRTRSRSSR